MKKKTTAITINRGSILNLFSPELSSRNRLVIAVEELIDNKVKVQLTDTQNMETIIVNRNQLRERT